MLAREECRTKQIRMDSESVLDRVRADAIERWGVPSHIADRACEVTGSRIGWDGSQPARSAARTESYCWAVLRGMVLRSKDGRLSCLKSRFALATIVEDMLSRGMDPWTVREAVLEIHSDLLAACGINEDEFDVAC